MGVSIEHVKRALGTLRVKAGGRLQSCGVLFMLVLALLVSSVGDARAETIQWIQLFGSTDDDMATDIAADSAGNIYVAGYIRGVIPNRYPKSWYYDVFLRKYDSNRNQLWSRQFSSLTMDVDGQFYLGTEPGLYVSLDGAGGVYVGGWAWGALPGQTHMGSSDAFVRKYGTDGTEIWTRQFGTTGADWVTDVATDAEGSVYAYGWIWMGALPGQTFTGPWNDRFLRKYDSAGNEVWTQQFGSGTDCACGGIAVDHGNNVYVANTSVFTEVFLRKFGPDGTSLWVRQIAPAGVPYVTPKEVVVDSAGSVYVAGSIWGLFHSPDRYDSDILLQKYDADGNQVWSRQSGRSSADEAEGVAVDADDNVYIAGYVMNPGWWRDAFVKKYDSSGNELWMNSFSSYGNTDDVAKAVTAGVQGVIYLAGYTYYGNFPGQTSSGGYDGFIAQVGTPTNRPPTVSAGGPYSVNEGSSVVVTASGNDPDAGVLAYAWDLDNNGTFETAGQSATLVAIDGPAVKTITVKATDPGGLSATSSTTVYVANVPPSAGIIVGPSGPVQVNSVINASASFTDPGVVDSHTASWNWGDGTSSPGTVGESNGSGAVGGSHAYAQAGVYTITLTVTDKDSGSGQASFQYAVVYDPNAGFVTGAGVIDSPAGAYASYPSLFGKAIFGFVAKYQVGANTPIGSTQFRFQLAGFSFNSTAYEWLVVSGPKAQFKGSGTINGAGDYAFLLTATDGALNGGGTVDKFRIKIWDKGTGAIVYDNMMGAGDSADPSTAISAGSIVINVK